MMTKKDYICHYEYDEVISAESPQEAAHEAFENITTFIQPMDIDVEEDED